MATRISYISLVRAFAAGKTAALAVRVATDPQFTVKMAASAFLIFMFFSAVYVIPVLMAIIWGTYWVSRAIQWIVYKFIPRTPENRWNVNAILSTIWEFPLIATLGWFFEAILVAIAYVPWVFIFEYQHKADWMNNVPYGGNGEDNLILIMWEKGMGMIAHGDVLDGLINLAFWNPEHPVMSVIKIVVIVLFTLQSLKEGGHDRISKKTFLAHPDNEHIDLCYEPRTPMNRSLEINNWSA